MLTQRRSRLFASCATWLPLALLGACSADPPPRPPQGPRSPTMPPPAIMEPDAGPPIVVMPPTCDASNMYCGERGEMPMDACGNQVYDMSPSGVQVMFVLDGSSSMAPQWQSIADAMLTSLNTYPNIAFGVHLFYATSDFAGLFSDGNICGAEENVYLDVDPSNGQNIFDTMGPQPPGAGNQYFDTSPVVQALNYYLENDTKLANPETTNYVVVISDANDNCFGTFLASDDDKNSAFAKIASEMQKKHIRVIPVGFDASTGMRDWDGEVQTNLPALEALAQYGGAVPEPLAADDPAELAQVIANIGNAVATCRYEIPAALDPAQDLTGFEIEYFVNGIPVERDRTEQDGWNFVAGNDGKVEFWGPPCEAIRAGESLEAKKACNAEKVCGTAAGKLETRQRAIQFALDSSASMGFFDDCFPIFDEDCVTFWGQAVNAISDALVSPVNDDAEIGIQFFPREDIGPLDREMFCEVADAPEIVPAEGMEVSVIKKLLANLPVGSTPLVQVVEKTAENPGRLGEDATAGALIVIGDGEQANDCGMIPPEEAVTRLDAAAAKLHDEFNTRVYAIKFGNSGDLAVENQLNAIAHGGGTGELRIAKDGEALTQVLAEISDELASCVIDINLDAPGADPTNINIYLNGQNVPQDPMRAEGWQWLDEMDKKSIELHGEFCSELKGGRLTNLVVEYGCETIVIY